MIIDQEIMKQMDKLREHLPTEQSLLLPLLHAMQAKEGWISIEAMREAATYLGLAPARVQEVVSFYTMYNRKPVGKKHVQVCTNVACFLRGADKLVEGLEERLGIHCGQTTKDGAYTLTEVECLAACGTAPVMQINDDYYENLDAKTVNQIMDKLDSELRHG